jgi:hypothetical protein
VTGIRATGLLLASDQLAVANLDITDNTLFVLGNGVVFGTNDTRIAGNDISSIFTAGSGSGIRVVPGSLPNRPVSGVRITANRIRGMAAHGILLAAHLKDAFVGENTLEMLGGGGVVMMGELAMAVRLTVEQNRIAAVCLRQLLDAKANDNLNRKLQAFGSSAYVGGAAIEVVSAQAVVVTGNIIDNSAAAAAAIGPLAGIRVTDSFVVRIAANQVMGLGTSGSEEAIAGVVVTGAFTQLDVVDNLVRHGGNLTAAGQPWRALLVLQPSIKPVAVGKGEKDDLSLAELRRLLKEFPSASSTAVRGNSFECAGLAPFVRVETGGDCLVGDNRVRAEAKNGTIVEITTRTVVFNANYVTGGGGDMRAVHLQPSLPQLTVLGNLTTGAIEVHAIPLKMPWAPLNGRA